MTTPTTRTSTPTAADLIAGLRARGATPVPPTRAAGRDAAIDAAAARELRCRACGHRGLTWTALWLRGSHNAISACTACGDASLA